jgi:hypothetical protein
MKIMLCRTHTVTAAALLCLAGIAVQADSVGASPWRADEGNTRGWQLMSQQERIDHQARVRGFTDYDNCKIYRKQHHKLMEDRARERGLDLSDDHENFCKRLKHGEQSEPD